MYIKLNRNGYLWLVQMTEILLDGELANGTRAYTARGEFFRDGVSLGFGRWDGEMFDVAPELLPSLDASQDVLTALEREVRVELAKLGAGAA
jgi:hypothetical protein